MTSKLFEVRDRGTLMVVMATRLDTADAREHAMLAHAGYGTRIADHGYYIILTPLDGGVKIAKSDPYEWRTHARTLATVHHHLYEIGKFDELESGALIDVEFLWGERETPKETEIRS